VLSVGIVAPYDYLFQNRETKDLETIYFEEVAKAPGCSRGSRTRPVRTSSGRRKEYSYRSTQAAGDGWCVIGDAFGFLDPLYSSGVLLALTSAAMAADTITEGIKMATRAKRSCRKWEAPFNAGMDRMRRLVCEFYDGFSFGRFVKRYPHLKGHVTDVLIGTSSRTTSISSGR